MQSSRDNARGIRNITANPSMSSLTISRVVPELFRIVEIHSTEPVCCWS